jgi:hypothetical protein
VTENQKLYLFPLRVSLFKIIVHCSFSPSTMMNDFSYLFLFIISLVSGNTNGDNILLPKSSKAQNQFDKEELQAHLQFIKDLRASQQHQQPVENKPREYPKQGDDTRKKQEVAIDPATGNLIDLETGEIIPM